MSGRRQQPGILLSNNKYANRQYLYNYGDEYVNFTGGWSIGSYDVCEVSKESDHFSWVKGSGFHHYGVIHTNNKIHFDNETYLAVYFDFEDYIPNSLGASLSVYLSNNPNDGGYVIGSEGASEYKNQRFYELDVTNINTIDLSTIPSGDYYVYVKHDSYGGQEGYCNLYAMWIEMGTISKTFLYMDGTSYVQFDDAIVRADNYQTQTGSTVSYNQDGIEVQFYANDLYQNYAYYVQRIYTVIYTSQKYDISNYRKLKVQYDVLDNEIRYHDTANPAPSIGLLSSITEDTTNNGLTLDQLFDVRASSSSVITLDISEYTGEYYIGVCVGNADTAATVKICRIWLE